MVHLDPETIAAFAAGTLPRDVSARAMGHITTCDACRIKVSDASFDAMETNHEDEDESIKNPEPLNSGAIVAERYRVEGVLGRGGMGTVYSARHVQRGHLVAIKVMVHTSGSGVARFLREASTCAKLTSEHVARVFDSGRLPSGAPYLVMEYLSGHELAAVIARGPVPISDAANYVMQACIGLAEAHAMGIVHRDIKPENLFVTRRADGTPLVKVLDFGVSKITRTNLDSESSLTATQALLGTPSYMAPEQLMAAKSVDARADVWSIGVVLFQLLSGRLPFLGANILQLMHATTMTTPPPISTLRADVPREIEECVHWCLQHEPERRYAQVDQIAGTLAPFVLR
jgi:eukaryotic-like serine/threonine-protein kinase